MSHPESDSLAPDFTASDREPIHNPGAIQPHGVLLVLREPDLTIVQVSANTASILGKEPEQLLNTPLLELLGAVQVDKIHGCLDDDFDLINPLHLAVPPAQPTRWMDGMIHRTDGGIILELEPAHPQAEPEDAHFFGFYQLVKGALNRMQSAATVEQLAQVIVQEIGRISGYDRVMVYQLAAGAGRVIAEERREDLLPYLGLHYPATDIPEVAQQLYTLKWLRVIPQVNYNPVPLIPMLNPLRDRPTDLSLSTLRSASPCHIEYLQNMGVQATLTISLLKQQHLWGLIACHHRTPKFIPYPLRIACEFLGQVMSMELIAKEENEDLDYKVKLKSIQARFVEVLSQSDQLLSRLLSTDLPLLDLVSAQGAAIYWNQEFTSLGQTPNPDDLHHLLEWIESYTEDNLFYTDALPSLYSPADRYQSIASGLIALAISRTNRNYILWFRPEVLQTISWGGNPDQPVEISEDGEKRLTPRKSFALWQETVRGKSLPWKACEIEAVQEFRSAIVGTVLRQADELARINVELERSNDELDSFAYIASHDLKEPLRGIHNYANFLIEDYADVLSEDGVSKLQTLVRLTQRMEDLINSLLHFSRLGRVDLKLQPVDLNVVVHNVLDVLSISKELQVEIRIPRPLPTVYCDRIQIAELFTNLISNAMKYNDKAEKWVEIGFFEGDRGLGGRRDGGVTSLPSPSASPSPPTPHSPLPTPTFYIRDNGIGIRERHLENIFRIFKRLHGPNQYGGGTGAGLTIAKKIVERHGGRIWVESTYGEGSTFYFTLQS